jgi:hypothetical protein
MRSCLEFTLGRVEALGIDTRAQLVDVHGSERWGGHSEWQLLFFEDCDSSYSPGRSSPKLYSCFPLEPFFASSHTGVSHWRSLHLKSGAFDANWPLAFFARLSHSSPPHVGHASGSPRAVRRRCR